MGTLGLIALAAFSAMLTYHVGDTIAKVLEYLWERYNRG